jgi:hypothetical protein
MMLKSLAKAFLGDILGWEKCGSIAPWRMNDGIAITCERLKGHAGNLHTTSRRQAWRDR